MVKRLLVLFCFISFVATAQKHLISKITFDKKAVYVGEPVEMCVSLYTSTWFTDGVDPGNIQVEGGYTVYFRSVSNSIKVNNKLYAGVSMYFHVFPYTDENITVPSLAFDVYTPDEGDYKGVKRTIRTKPKTIVVKSIPPQIKANEWLVSPSVLVYEKWNHNLKNIKVGDVVERVVRVKASNTLPEFLTDIQWDTIPGIGLYHSRPHFKNHKTKTAISAEKTATVQYLFEKEGVYTIPEIVVKWWNPTKKKMYVRKLKAQKVNVNPNPDSDIVATVKRNLENESFEKDKTEFDTKKFVKILKWGLGIVIVFIVLIRFYKRVRTAALSLYYKICKAVKSTELYCFVNFLFSFKLSKRFYYLYQWAKLHTDAEPTITALVNRYGSVKMQTIFKECKTEKDFNNFLISNAFEWVLLRRTVLKSNRQPDDVDLN